MMILGREKTCVSVVSLFPALTYNKNMFLLQICWATFCRHFQKGKVCLHLRLKCPCSTVAYYNKLGTSQIGLVRVWRLCKNTHATTVKSYSLLKNDNKHLTCCDAFSTPTAEVEEGQKILLTRLFKHGSALYDSLDDMAKNKLLNNE